MYALIKQLNTSLNYNLVRNLVDLDQAPVVLVQVFVDLVQAYFPQGELISVVSRQVVAGLGLGLIGSVWSVFVRGGRRNRFVIHRLCVGRVGCIRAKGVSWLH